MYREIRLLNLLIDKIIRQQEEAARDCNGVRDFNRRNTHSYCAERFKDLKTEIEDIFGFIEEEGE